MVTLMGAVNRYMVVVKRIATIVTQGGHQGHNQQEGHHGHSQQEGHYYQSK
jgi:hypothetical protein